MSALLIGIIFIAYVGLGIPDSLFGAAWPAIYQDLSLPVSYASFVTSVVYLGTILSSFMSTRVIKKLGTANTALLSTFLTAMALLGFSFSNNIIFFCLFAFPLGIGAGSIDTALNNYVALNYNATLLNFLHCFYGVGVTVSPYLMSLALSNNNDWRHGYRAIFIIQISIAALLLVTLPVWKKVKTKKLQAQSDITVLSINQAIRMKKAKSSISVFLGSCGIESICLIWASTYLVETRSFNADRAAGIVTIYFIGLTAGRFLSGVLARFLSCKTIMLLGQAITLVAIMLLIIKLPVAALYIGLFLIGLGNGPQFPNMTHLTPKIFGESCSQSMIGIEMGFAYISIFGSPLIFGIVAQYIGCFMMPYFLLGLFLVMSISTALLFKGLRID